MNRVISFILAAIIFGSAVVSAVFVIKSIRDEQSTEDALGSGSQVTAEATQDTSQQTNQENTNMLEGTQLANFTPETSSVTEVKIIDLVVGTGEEVKAGATVTAHYTGALASTGVIFQSSKDTGNQFTSPLANLIVGWQEGIPGMKVGGTRRILIPAAKAYGAAERPGIPANSDLVFDIELSAVEQ